MPQIAIITRVELESGSARKVPQWELRQARLDALLKRLVVHDFDRNCADAYRQIIAAIGFSRPKLLDHMIAATALAHGLTLATANGKDFADIPSLSLESW